MKSSTTLKASPDKQPESKASGSFRPARALIGWMPPDAAHQLLVGGRADQTITPEVVARARSTRDFAAARTPIKQENVLGPPPTGISEHLALLRKNAQNLFDEGFRVCTVDLSRLYAIQPITFIDHYIAAAEALRPEDVRGIAEMTLPTAVEVQLSVAQDPLQKTTTVACSNPNLQLVGLLPPQMGPTGCSVGVQTTVLNSLLQVAHLDDRFYCRDGHTRALQLLKCGISRVPALIKEFASYAEVAPRPNLLPEMVALGANPPALQDFLDNRISAEVLLPTTRKAIVVSATEIEIPV
jgi:hypothetical protein